MYSQEEFSRIYDNLPLTGRPAGTGHAPTEEVPGGVKFDQDKVPMELLSVQAITEIAKVLQFGAKKYAPRNWEKGLDYSRAYAAALRHLFEWWAGEDNDPETGLSHVAHAACCLMFLSHYIETGRTDLEARPCRTVLRKILEGREGDRRPRVQL